MTASSSKFYGFLATFYLVSGAVVSAVDFLPANSLPEAEALAHQWILASPESTAITWGVPPVSCMPGATVSYTLTFTGVLDNSAPENQEFMRMENLDD